MTRLRLKPDPFLIFLLGSVLLASLVPVRGAAAAFADGLTNAAIALLFFLHGAKLSRRAIGAGLGASQIHITTFCATFILFPLIGLAVARLCAVWLSPWVADGVLFLTLLPSTVQSSIAFTAIARGNVAAAVCSASASNIAGIVLTPLLAMMLLGHAGGAMSADMFGTIIAQLLLPFMIGHLSRPLTASFVERHRTLVGRVDRGSILLVVYTAFSASVVQGLWHSVSLDDVVHILLIDALILALMIVITRWTARRLGFSRADETVVVFCGSKKSLASGVPMAGAIFPRALVGPIILPLMLFHQLQLILCAILAQRYAAASLAQENDRMVSYMPPLADGR